MLPPAAFTTAATVPSPPSATGSPTHSQSEKISFAAIVSSSVIRLLVRLPLNESEANRNFILSSPWLDPFFQIHECYLIVERPVVKNGISRPLIQANIVYAFCARKKLVTLTGKPAFDLG